MAPACPYYEAGGVRYVGRVEMTTLLRFDTPTYDEPIGGRLGAYGVSFPVGLSVALFADGEVSAYPGFSGSTDPYSSDSPPRSSSGALLAAGSGLGGFALWVGGYEWYVTAAERTLLIAADSRWEDHFTEVVVPDEDGDRTPTPGPVVPVPVAPSGLVMPSWLSKLVEREGAAHADDDEFEGTTLDAAWTPVVPSGTQNLTVQDGLLSVAFSSQNRDDVCGIVKPLSATSHPKTIETVFRIFGQQGEPKVGLVFAKGSATSSQVVTARLVHRDEDFSQINFGWDWFHDIGSRWSTRANPIYSPLYLRFVWKTGSTYSITASIDGVSWVTLMDSRQPGRILSDPTHYGIVWSSGSDPDTFTAAFEYFRVYDEDLA